MVSKIAGYIPVPRHCMACNKAKPIAYIIGIETVCADCAAPAVRAHDDALTALAALFGSIEMHEDAILAADAPLPAP